MIRLSWANLLLQIGADVVLAVDIASGYVFESSIMKIPSFSAPRASHRNGDIGCSVGRRTNKGIVTPILKGPMCAGPRPAIWAKGIRTVLIDGVQTFLQTSHVVKGAHETSRFRFRKYRGGHQRNQTKN